MEVHQRPRLDRGAHTVLFRLGVPVHLGREQAALPGNVIAAWLSVVRETLEVIAVTADAPM
jgi:hypothetical protein